MTLDITQFNQQFGQQLDTAGETSPTGDGIWTRYNLQYALDHGLFAPGSEAEAFAAQLNTTASNDPAAAGMESIATADHQAFFYGVRTQALAGTAPPPAPSPAASNTNASEIFTGTGAAIGVSEPEHEYDFNPNGDDSSLQTYIADTGKTPASANVFVGWDNAADPANALHSQIPAGFLDKCAQNGITPMMTWTPGGDLAYGSPNLLPDIVSGKSDAYITQMAEQLKASGNTVLLRFGHEMNLVGQYSYAGHPADYVAAYRHVVDLFRQAGATNVKFVWCPNNGGTNIDGTTGLITPDTARAYYPGDDYVDVLAFDAYPGTDGNGANFSDLIRAPYQVVSAVSPGKPVMIAETGTGGTDEEKSAFFGSMKSALESGEFPALRAISYFDFNKKSDPNNPFERDWRVAQSPVTLSAWQQVIGSPAAQGQYTNAA